MLLLTAKDAKTLLSIPNLLFADKDFFLTMLRLATPIALQNLIIFSLGMIDVIMVGQLGETPVAAIGLAEQPFFLFVPLLFGISSGAAIFTAQFWGRRDIRRIRSVLGICLLLSLAEPAYRDERTIKNGRKLHQRCP